MPMQQGFLCKIISDPCLKPLPQHEGKTISAPAVCNAKNFRGTAVNLNNS